MSIDQLCFPKGMVYTKRDFQRLLEKKGSYTVVAELNEQIVAFGITLTNTAEKKMHLVTLDVLPSLQGKRIGSLLMNHIFNCACLDKIKSIDLEVAEDNPKAVRFYRGQGFRTVRRLKKYYVNNRDALLMTRKPK